MATIKDNTASQRIYIRVTPEEKELIKKYANIDKLSTTDYLKKLALKEAIISNRLEYTNDLKELNFHLGKIGNNINQLTAHVNRAEKFQVIDASTIHHFRVFIGQYLDLLKSVDSTLKLMFKKISKIK